MRPKNAKSVIGVLSIIALLAPAGLSAKDRRGATVIVTRSDGEAVEGELVAVKPEGLFLLSAEGNARTVDRADINSVRIVRRSRAGLFAGIGGVAGLAGMGALVLSGGNDVDYGTEKVLIGAGIGALAGFLAGIVKGIDSEFTVAGQLEAVVADHWRKLAGYSREGRLKGPMPPSEPAARPPVRAADAPPRAPRLKIGLSVSIPIAPEGFLSSNGEGSFEFGDVTYVPPDPHLIPVQFSQAQRRELTDVHFGPLSLAYDLTGKMSADIEIVHSGQARAAGSAYGEMDYTSFPEGIHYSAWAGGNYNTSFTSVLAGLSFRTKPPSALDRHIFEVGAAAGAALGAMTMMTADGGTQDLRRIAFSARVQAAYDFYIIPTVSLGAVVGYRHLRIGFPASTYTAQTEFFEVGNESNTVTRLVNIVIPGQTVRWPGPFIGFRLGIRL